MNKPHKSKHKIFSIKSTSFFLFFVSLFLQASVVTYAAAFCITDPGGPSGDPFDNRCPVTASITPSASSVSSGSSVSIILYAKTIYEWWINGLATVDASMTDTVTGVVTVLSTGPGYTTGTWSQNVSSGPLTNSVSLSIYAESEQGVVQTDSSFVTVTASASTPTVLLKFSSVFNAVKNYFVAPVLARTYHPVFDNSN